MCELASFLKPGCFHMNAKDLSLQKSLRIKTGIFLGGLNSAWTTRYIQASHLWPYHFFGEVYGLSSHFPSGNCSEVLYFCCALAVCFLWDRDYYWSWPPGLQIILKTKSNGKPLTGETSLPAYFLWGRVFNKQLLLHQLHLSCKCRVLFVHLPFEKNLLNVPLCPLENRGLFLCPL